MKKIQDVETNSEFLIDFWAVQVYNKRVKSGNVLRYRAMKIKKAEILCVGTELLLGEVVNTNAAYIGRALASLGISVYRTTVVGDNPSRLRSAFISAHANSDLVIMSGGLGPTYDDLTKETVASTLGLKMVRDEKILAYIESYFAKTGRKMTENNKKQADVPEGSMALENKYGTAPGIAIQTEGKLVIMLPGPPSELNSMMDTQVVPLVKKMTDSIIFSKNIHIMGMGESEVESILRELMTESTNPTIAPYAKEGEVRLRVSAMAESKEAAEQMCDSVIEKVKQTRVGEFIYGIDVSNIENALVIKLREKHLTLACAESCTGGLIAKRITDISGASEVFSGGCVTYNNDAKMKLLGVSAETLEKYSAVSDQTAKEMARGARLALGADIGVSTTGVAGPALDPTSDEPVGTVYIGISTVKGDFSLKLSLSDQRSREYIRFVAASRAIREIIEKI